MIELLSSPFPLRRNRALDFLSILLIGVFVVLFLLIFQPFDTNEIESPYRELFLSGYSVIIVLIFLFFRFVTPRFFVSPSVEKSWTLGKQLVWIVGQFFATSIAWYLYWAWFFDVELTFSGWGRFILVSFSVLVFPLAALIVSGYIFQLQKNKQPIPSTNRSISRGNPDGALVQQLFLSEDSSIGGFYVPTDQFLFVRAAIYGDLASCPDEPRRDGPDDVFDAALRPKRGPESDDRDPHGSAQGMEIPSCAQRSDIASRT